jgi:CPA2 family monovalent cation:H+ antiporter-2
MIWLGFVTGQLFGWTTLESLFCGAIIAISSTTIIAKAFDEQGVRGSLRDLVVGVLIVEDLIAIMLMTTLTAVATGSGLSAMDFAKTTGKLGLFLALLMGFGLLLVPRGVRAVLRLGRPETTLVASIGFCFGVSLLAHAAGYSVALGAFIAGSLIAESGEAKPIEHLVQPVRDVFAAIFFVSVGVLIDPQLLAQHWQAIAVISVVVIVGKIIGVSLGAFLTGSGVRTSVQAGMSLAQIGEFSFIIAGLGLSLKATGEFLYPVAVAVSAITTLTTPWLIKASGPVASFIDRKMPGPLQTFVTLYGSWIQSFGAAKASKGKSLQRLFRLLLLDFGLLLALVLGSVLGSARLSTMLETKLSLSEDVSHGVLVAGTLVLAVPLVLGIVRLARELGLALAVTALPGVQNESQLDLAATPRKALVVTLQLAVVLLVGSVFLAVTQPFLGGGYAPALFGALLVFLGIGFWRGATELHGHVRAGAQVVLEALVEQAHQGGVDPSAAPRRSHADLSAVQQLLPGLGEPTPLELEPSSPAIGRSLSQLNLRGITGASVLAIQRGEEGVLVPSASDVLKAGDVLALAGSHDAIAAARALLAAVTRRPDDDLPSTPLAV